MRTSQLNREKVEITSGYEGAGVLGYVCMVLSHLVHACALDEHSVSLKLNSSK